ncbi:MAG: cytochrome c-type biogenesis protein CcmH [Anaerolineae bacterium]|nr:cytochrome c-type biogenesis protein CcmH [Anaerolineae bacterium]
MTLALLFAAGIAPRGVITAQSPTPTLRPVSDNEVNRVAKNLYCPVCQNVPLEVCETEACARWREQVRDLLAQGYTEEQVRQYFIERFGTKTVGTPVDTVSRLLNIALPFALIGLIGVVIAFNLVRWRSNRRPVEADDTSIPTNAVDIDIDSPPLDDYRARLEEEIRKRE